MAFPHLVVADRPDLVALACLPGSTGKVLRDRGYGPNELVDHVWRDHLVLRLAAPAEAHSVELHWRAADGGFRGWYLNLQAPLQRTPLGWDTTDHDLDVWIDADGTATLKDVDELAAAVRAGAFTPAQAAEIHAEAERALARYRAGAPPFGQGWERRHPDRAWRPPRLAPGWASSA